jgi:hypothetical protein
VKHDLLLLEKGINCKCLKQHAWEIGRKKDEGENGGNYTMRYILSHTVTKKYCDSENKEVTMGWTRTEVEFWWGNLLESDNLGHWRGDWKDNINTDHM